MLTSHPEEARGCRRTVVTGWGSMDTHVLILDSTKTDDDDQNYPNAG